MDEWQLMESIDADPGRAGAFAAKPTTPFHNNRSSKRPVKICSPLFMRTEIAWRFCGIKKRSQR